MDEFKERAKEFAAEKGFNSIYRQGNNFYFISDSLSVKRMRGEVEYLIGESDVRAVFVPSWDALEVYDNLECIWILNKG